MPARYRELDERSGNSGSYYFYLTGTQNRSANDGQFRKCWDVVNNYPNVNPFESHRLWTIRGKLEGEQRTTSGQLTRKCLAWPIDRVPTAPDPRSHWGPLSPSDVQGLMRDLLNRTSPSQPYFELPTFVGELKDIAPPLLNLTLDWRLILRDLASRNSFDQLKALPRLVRAYGNSLLGMAGTSYLSWRWVIKPMISDLRKLCQFGHAVEKRRVELARLSEPGGGKRRVSIRSQTYQTDLERKSINSSVGTVTYADVNTLYTEKVWGCARWKLSPTGNPSLPIDVDRVLSRTFRLTFGITSWSALQALWELTPWSWFIDWFSQLGDVLSLYNNSVACYWADACVMRTIFAKNIVHIDRSTIPSWAVFTQEPVEEYTIKERYNDVTLWLPTLPTYLPVLDPGKWSILASLAAIHTDKGLPFWMRSAFAKSK